MINMQKEKIFVFGQDLIVPAVLEQGKQHTTITTGLQKHNHISNYICLNDTDQLDQLMQSRNTQALILSPRNLYAKYAFYDRIEALPHFEDLVAYKWDSHAVSQQLLGVAMAAWMGANIVIMAGFEMHGKKEEANLRAIMTLYGDIEFLHVSKENKIFDNIKLKNFTSMDQPQFKQRIRSNG